MLQFPVFDDIENILIGNIQGQFKEHNVYKR